MPTPTPANARAQIANRIFVGGCTAAYAVLIGSVLAALKLYAG
ncbi:MAG: hypothetical protein ACREEW_02820 [Caulobacteraceae bacterium]